MRPFNLEICSQFNTQQIRVFSLMNETVLTSVSANNSNAKHKVVSSGPTKFTCFFLIPLN